MQVANFGRDLSGTSDSLPGYSTSLIAIHDPSGSRDERVDAVEKYERHAQSGGCVCRTGID